MVAWILFVLGLAVGAGTGSALGALAWGTVGLLLGLSLNAIGWMRSHIGTPIPATGHHSVMCFPYGQAADCEFVGDVKSGRWYDVKRCSLLKAGKVDCDKGCIRMMNVTGARPGGACQCEEGDAPKSVAQQA